jgi:hypothetical protein
MTKRHTVLAVITVTIVVFSAMGLFSLANRPPRGSTEFGRKPPSLDDGQRPQQLPHPKPTPWQTIEPLAAPEVKFDPDAPIVDVAMEAAATSFVAGGTRNGRSDLRIRSQPV